jgi:hypothetical protein
MCRTPLPVGGTRMTEADARALAARRADVEITAYGRSLGGRATAEADGLLILDDREAVPLADVRWWEEVEA